MKSRARSHRNGSIRQNRPHKFGVGTHRDGSSGPPEDVARLSTINQLNFYASRCIQRSWSIKDKN
jgi:hypothetical protein